jgi:TRAP-type C4-dicarboxylate transport system permease small subunit
VSPASSPDAPRGTTPYWVLRILESGLLLGALAGLGLFAWSLVDIVRIETNPVLKGSIPPTAWPGVFTFFGSLLLLQVVRLFLYRYRRDDGTPRGGEVAAAAVTAEVLASVPEVPASTADAAEAPEEG